MIEVEIPAYYVESIESVGLSGWHVLNFSPSDTGSQVAPWFHGDVIGGLEPPPPDCYIEFEVVHIGEASGIDATGLNVIINGQFAIIGGALQAGYEGVITAPRPDTLHVVVRPTAGFASRQHVVPSVIMVDPSDPASTDLSPATSRFWSFVVADTVPPILYGAVGRELRLVRATWSEEVVLDEALTAANYALAPLPSDDRTPALTPVVTAVLLAGSYDDGLDEPVTIVDLVTDVELTPGTRYRLTASNVHDASGNTAPTSIIFDPFTPPHPAGRSFELWRFIPLINRQEDDTHDLERFVRCLQTIVDLQLFEVDRFTSLVDVDTAPIRFVEATLDDLGNPFPFLLDDIDKRRLAHLLVAIYADKGTERGIVNTVRFFVGIDVHVEDYVGGDMVLGISMLGTPPDDAAPGEYWVLGPGTTFALYAFRVVVNATLANPYPVLTDEQRFQIRTLTNYMKPAHTHFVELVEPRPAVITDHLSLGVSRLGDNWVLH